MRKYLKRIGIICLIPVVLTALLTVLLYLPPIQNWAVQKAARYTSEITGMEIGIGRIRLAFPLDLSLHQIEVINPPDTLLTLDRLTTRVDLYRIFKKMVSVESFSAEGLQFNTGTFINGMEAKGRIAYFTAKADSVNLAEEHATLSEVRLSDASAFLRIDSLQQDSAASKPVNWKLALDKVALENVSFIMRMPDDSLALSAVTADARLYGGLVDLGKSVYLADKVDLSALAFNYDGNNAKPAQGLDPVHIGLSDLQASVDSFLYSAGLIKAGIKSFTAKERSGLIVESITGQVAMDSLSVSVPGLTLKTPYSGMELHASVPFASFSDNPTGKMRALLLASIGKEDVAALAGSLPEGLKAAYPDKKIELSAGIEGNTGRLLLRKFTAELPGSLRLDVSGEVKAAMNSAKRDVKLQAKASAGNLNFVLASLSPEQRGRFNIPSGIILEGDIGITEERYDTKMRLTDSDGFVSIEAAYYPKTEGYNFTLDIDSLEPVRFMPTDSLMWFAASIQGEGRGTDLFAVSTYSSLKGKVAKVRYGKVDLPDVNLTASLKEHQANLQVTSENPSAKMDMSFDGTLKRDLVQGLLIMDVDTIDLYRLGITEDRFVTSFQLFAEGETDMKELGQLDVSLGNWDIITAKQRFKSQLLTLKARSDKDTAQLSFHTGDLGITLAGKASLGKMIDRFSLVSETIDEQLRTDSTINLPVIRPILPEMSLSVRAAKVNPVYNLLRQYSLGFNDFKLNASTSSESGVLMDMNIYAAYRDTFLLDTIRASIRPDSSGLLYSADIIKYRYRQQLPFKAHIRGAVKNKYLDAEVEYLNHKGETGVLLGMKVSKEQEGYRLNLFPDNPVVAFNTFSLNSDNYLLFKNLKDIDANIRFTGKNNASLWLHSIDGGGKYPEQHIELSQIDMGVASRGFTALPEMKGVFNADVRYSPDDETFMVVADVNIDELIYQGGRVGELMLNTVYLPLGNHEHQVDVHLYRDREEITAATVFYQPEKQDNIAGDLMITGLPLLMLNPFIPDNMMRLAGSMNGEMTLNGHLSKPDLNGYMQLDTGSVYIGMADTRLAFDSKKLIVKDNLLAFDKYSLRAAGNNPFVIDGHIDMSDLSRMMANLKFTANNMQVLDARRTRESLVYGKLFLNFNSTAKGPLDRLVVRGDAHLLGGTDVGYILTESPLTVQDRMDGLVTFTSFTDTLTRRGRQRERVRIGGTDLLMVLHIDPSVQFRVDLTPDRSDYIELEGGGDLSFQFSPQGDMLLNGRYTLSEGVVNYTLPVVPLKRFNIHQGSHVQWDGELMNPLVNLLATERMRATVDDGNASQRVNFDVGINVQDRLNNMQLGFVIDAVDNTNIKNELAVMGEDERTRQAVFMMVTGTYMASSGGDNMNFGAALNSFLMGEVNSIAGDVLKGVDIDVGLDTYDGVGGEQTDLTFSFAKRFYHDRIRLSIGGKVSTGANAQETESFLDNFSAEYLLDEAGNKTLKMFYDHNYDSLLEGEVVETGVGIVLRKKVLRLRELFDFRKKKVTPVEETETI